MNCLHICNDLMGSKVHENLYSHLQELGVNQKLYYPLREEKRNMVSKFNSSLKDSLLVSKPLSKFHRFFFRRKVQYLFSDLEERTDLKAFDIVHATTLFSDGAIALKIWKKYHIPYVVAVRGTDVNLFLKYRVDLYPLAREIISNAKQLFFISDSLNNNFLQNNLIRKLNPNEMPDQKVIYNGLDSFWIKNPDKKSTGKKATKFLYVGKFDGNKNVTSLIKAFLQVQKKHGDMQLNLVGSGGKEEAQVKKIAQDNAGVINFHGPIYDKNELRKLYKENDIFAMISISETFGLVYVEALSQGLPILFTKNQGIDGTFNNVGESVNPLSISSIAEGMEKMILNYTSYGAEISKIEFSNFYWERIAKTYFDLYHAILD